MPPSLKQLVPRPLTALGDMPKADAVSPSCVCLDYPVKSSAAVAFPDGSALVFDATEVWVERMMNPAEDRSVYTYSDDLIPIAPLSRYGHRFYAARYVFTEPEMELVDRAVQLLDTVLINVHGLRLPMSMRWFSPDRLLVKNLISAGGDEEALCSLLLGMLANNRLTTVLEPAAGERVDDMTVVIRHQTVP